MITLSATVRSVGAPELGRVERRLRALRSARTPNGSLIVLVPFAGAVVVRTDASTIRIELPPHTTVALPAAVAALDGVIRADGSSERVAITWTTVDEALTVR
ncbi:hypothetical protein HQQ80_06655 [Microbacteriaceae bacterium VKM Ac-2855]|nr:hypothetical protein [Microbacteriaceae bacterium VKM Ac-2855]